MGNATRAARSARTAPREIPESRASAETERGAATAPSGQTPRRGFHRLSARSCAVQMCRVARSIEFKFLHPGSVLRRLGLIGFRQKKIAHNKIIHTGPHKTGVR